MVASRVRTLLLAALLCISTAVEAAPRSLLFVTQIFPPIIENAGGDKLGGAQVEILQEACRRLDWRCEVRAMVWKRALRTISLGEADGLLLVQDVAERRAVMELSLPVLLSSYALYVVNGNPLRYRQPADLSGHVLAVYGPSLSQANSEQLLQGVAGVTEQVEPDPQTVLRKLAAGRYGAAAVAFSNADIARYWILQDGLSSVHQLATIKSISYMFGFTRSRLQPGTLDAFNQVLLSMCRDGSMSRLAGRYGLLAAGCH